MGRRNASGHINFSKGNYLQAHEDFLGTAALAIQIHRLPLAATAYSDAGGAALARQDFRDALTDFLKASGLAREAGESLALARTLNNLASLYLQMSNPEAALQVAKEGLDYSAGLPDRSVHPKLQFQLASALARLHRFDEARPVYRAAIDALDEQGDFEATSRALSSWGGAALEAGCIEEADAALTEALRIARMHRLGSANILRGLARVKDRQGDGRSALALFDASVAAAPGLTPRWIIYADRGDFRLARNNLNGALADFRAASQYVSLMRADIVPADQDRVTLESGLSRVTGGVVEAANRLARQTSDKAFLEEAFNAAEQERLWTLRALMPAPNDWRSRLPRNYWDLLAHYRSVERTLLAEPTEGKSDQAAALHLQLQQMEATAGAGETSGNFSVLASPLGRAQRLLDRDTVLFSFHLAAHSGWLWAADRDHVNVYGIPASPAIEAAVSGFSGALKAGEASAPALGRDLYRKLFNGVPPSYLAHKRWLLELDGPLFDLPFAALVVSEIHASRENPPDYLIEHASLEAIPNILLLESNGAPASGEMVSIGDPVYNAADSRYRGQRNLTTSGNMVLPRLIATADEVEVCSRAWGPDRTRVLSGADAGLDGVEAALDAGPSIIHFATHVIAGPDDRSSGLIALSLDSSGAMGFMGPAEILAHPVTASLVVLNGCYSARGATLPGTGLMGLTRAWIGAGAGAVLATRWNISDDAGQSLMAAFYRHLRASWSQGPAFALQQAQLELLKNEPARKRSDLLGAYFLLGRV
jgi:CHAT domain-containing protein